MVNKKFIKRILALGSALFLGFAFPSQAFAITAYAANTVAEPKLNISSQSIVKGKTFALRIYNLSEKQTVTYKSSNKSVASVDADGVITAVSVGTTTIKVTVKEGFKTICTLSCSITVGPAAISVTFADTELTMEVGKHKTLDKLLQPISTAEVPKFSSEDTEIASVSAGGRITARSVGSTYIYAQLENGFCASCYVTVVPNENGDTYIIDDIFIDESPNESDEEDSADYSIVLETIDTDDETDMTDTDDVSGDFDDTDEDNNLNDTSYTENETDDTDLENDDEQKDEDGEITLFSSETPEVEVIHPLEPLEPVESLNGTETYNFLKDFSLVFPKCFNNFLNK